MKPMSRLFLAIALAAPLAACATTFPPSPVEVTRFHDGERVASLEAGPIFVESAPASAAAEGSLELSPYKAAVARELVQLGFIESARSEANLVAEVRVERFEIADDAPRRGPVSVGMGGSTGSYGSGVGLGIGLNLGGGQSRDRVGTRMAVVIRDLASSAVVWEGRALFEVGPEHALAEPSANARVVAEALFSDFPGGQGETIEVKVPK